VPNTGKFPNKNTETGPGLRHAIGRHAHPSISKAPDIPISPGKYRTARQSSDASVFPESMSVGDIEDAINLAVRKGRTAPADDSDVVYTGSELQTKYGIEKIVVRRDKQSGLLVSARPGKDYY
jgi:hypothetical protein